VPRTAAILRAAGIPCTYISRRFRSSDPDGNEEDPDRKHEDLGDGKAAVSIGDMNRRGNGRRT